MGEFIKEPLIKDEQGDTFEACQCLREPMSFEVGLQIIDPEIAPLKSDTFSLLDKAFGEHRSQKRFTGSGRTSDEDKPCANDFCKKIVRNCRASEILAKPSRAAGDK